MLAANTRKAGETRRLAALPPSLRNSAFTFILDNHLMADARPHPPRAKGTEPGDGQQ